MDFRPSMLPLVPARVSRGSPGGHPHLKYGGCARPKTSMPRHTVIAARTMVVVVRTLSLTSVHNSVTAARRLQQASSLTLYYPKGTSES